MRMNPFPTHGDPDPIDVFLFGWIPFLIVFCGIGSFLVSVISSIVSWLFGVGGAQ